MEHAVSDDVYLFISKEVHLDIGKTYTLRIQFDPAYKEDLHIRTIDEVLHIAYKEHPHIVSLRLWFFSLCPPYFELILAVYLKVSF